MTTQPSAAALVPSNGTQLTLVAFIRAKPGQGGELGRRLWTLVEPARAEPGNINYDLHRSNDDPDVWVLYENWQAPSDLTAHFELPYMKEFIAALPEVLEGEMDLHRCAMVTTVAATANADFPSHGCVWRPLLPVGE
ncbi:putative quinol monooxygenase [Mesorhizobium sp. LjRoot246]|uniref:putative quinol monooxygenase n=1 Tax=Mesorhizobium sp. LjRoot246 TaxID=3342294 RepID=UPI003ECDE0AD